MLSNDSAPNALAKRPEDSGSIGIRWLARLRLTRGAALGGLVAGDHGEVARRFADDLVMLRQLAGRPSYATLERLSGHKLKRATMSDVLNGNRVNLPDWRFIHEFVTACRAAAAENGLDANELGTVADWKRHWDSAAGGVIGGRFPGHGGLSFSRQE